MKFSRPANTAEVVEFEEIDPQIGQRPADRAKVANAPQSRQAFAF
jgi:hypothetical protein